MNGKGGFMMSEKRKIQRFNLDEGRIWEAIEGLSPFKTTYTLEEVCEKLNELSGENEQLRKAEKINMDYAEQIVEENQKLRIAKNNLRRENEQLSIIRRDEIKYWKNKYDNAVETFDVDETTATKIRELEKENEQLKQKLENLGLNEKNDAIKMIEGKFFIRM